MSDSQLRRIRGRQIAMIFQDPMTSLNPVLTIGRQLREPLETHLGMNKNEALDRAAELLDQVGIPSARQRLKDYPHQFSGGMRQRAMIAMALACEPKLLIADEPTTALDVTIQAQILDLLRELVAERDTALIMITHDLGVVAGICERVKVMYAGTFVESGSRRPDLRRSRGIRTRSGCSRACRGSTRVASTALNPIAGQPRNMLEAPTSCPFAPRCRFRQSRCDAELPLLRELEPGHEAACFFPVDADAWSRSRLVGVGMSTSVQARRSSRSTTCGCGSRSRAASCSTVTSAT